MQAATIAILIVLALLLVVLVALEVRSLRAPALAAADPFALHVGRTLVVHRLGGSSIRGVLAEVYPDTLVLRAAHHLGENATEHPVDGSALIDRSKVDFFQLLDVSVAA